MGMRKFRRIGPMNNDRFFRCTPKRYWEKASIYMEQPNSIPEKETVTVKKDPVEELIEQYSRGEITIEEYEEKVKEVIDKSDN